MTNAQSLQDYQAEFIEQAIEKNALNFGTFTLKSGRISPYFFNAGALTDGKSLSILANAYTQLYKDLTLDIDCLFGPAYKGIALAALCTMNIYQKLGTNLNYAYNRKEVKTHGEGGNLVGTLQGKVLIIDDVITAGTAIRQSIEQIRAANATPTTVFTALDRMEKGQGEQSSVLELKNRDNIDVYSIININHIILYLESIKHPKLTDMLAYRTEFGQ